MAEATRYRLDNADLAVESGWHLDSSGHDDIFTRGGVTIHAQYTSNDVVDDLVKTGPNGEVETADDVSIGAVDLLRLWLTGRQPDGGGSGGSLPPAECGRYKDGWTRDEFVNAVVGANDQGFLARFFALVDANGQLPTLGGQPRLFFGTRPSGGMFVYPFGRRHPPFKFLISNDGRLMISGCWTGFPEVKGHKGFAELASLLDLDENGPATRVPVFGLDPDELWNVGERVSRAINS